MYLIVCNYVYLPFLTTANWDGIYDHETGLLGYSVTVGTALCEEKLKEHHDPHAHLFDPSQWTNSVMMTPLVPPQLPGKNFRCFDDCVVYSLIDLLCKALTFMMMHCSHVSLVYFQVE